MINVASLYDSFTSGRVYMVYMYVCIVVVVECMCAQGVGGRSESDVSERVSWFRGGERLNVFVGVARGFERIE